MPRQGCVFESSGAIPVPPNTHLSQARGPRCRRCCAASARHNSPTASDRLGTHWLQPNQSNSSRREFTARRRPAPSGAAEMYLCSAAGRFRRHQQGTASPPSPQSPPRCLGGSHEAREGAAGARGQLPRAARLHQPPPVQHQQAVAVHDGVDAVRDHQQRPPGQKQVEDQNETSWLGIYCV